MDSLTGRRRHGSKEDDDDSPKRQKSFISDEKEFVPDLYKSMGSKKFRAEQPENEEERALIKALPCDTETAILHLRNSFPSQLFKGRIPPIVLYSQLSAILSNQFLIDTQLSKLAKDNKILTFSPFSTANYLIVLREDFVGLKREGVFQRFVSQVMDTKAEDGDVQRSLENSKYFSKESLRKRWKFEEDEIRQLVNGGFLGIAESEMYCTSLPGAGEFIKCYEKGKKAVLGAIKRAKFGQILQTELEQRPMKKVAPLGVLYHIYALIGSGEVEKVETTSGFLLRVKRQSS